MAQGLEVDLKPIVLADSSFGPATINQITEAIRSDSTQFRSLREAVQELQRRESPSPASNVRLGVCYFLLGEHGPAIEVLEAADSGALAHYYMGRAYIEREEYAKARECFEAAQRAVYNSDDCALAETECLRLEGRADEALAKLNALSGAVEQTAEYLYQRASTISRLGSNPDEAVALFERAVEADETHAGALFGLAVENDRRGNDDTALDLYRRSTSQFPPHVGALINLGVLYEDAGDYENARRCYQMILDAHPSHRRARLYLKDTEASGDMYYDEDAQKKRDRLSQMLGIPVTDFELSVRSRNCLQRMGVMTLGDLTMTSEQELLASKNFGETSLVEIREMLSSKGLSLGQFAGERRRAEAAYELDSLTDDEQAMLNKNISELNLSVRARKCMVRLGINTIADLVRHTGDELLECKNFGVTSLNEVREKLTAQNLSLRGE